MDHAGLMCKFDCLEYTPRSSEHCVRPQGLTEETARAEYPCD